MGKFISDPAWLPVLREHEEKLRFDSFSRDDALAIGLTILRLAKEKYNGDLCVSITEDDTVIFSCKMAGSKLENDAWMLRKRNVSKLTGVSSLRAYLEVEAGLREEAWLDREDSFAACGGCIPVLMRQGATFAYITVSGLEHYLDHQIIADAVAEHLGVQIESIAPAK